MAKTSLTERAARAIARRVAEVSAVEKDPIALGKLAAALVRAERVLAPGRLALAKRREARRLAVAEAARPVPVGREARAMAQLAREAREGEVEVLEEGAW